MGWIAWQNKLNSNHIGAKLKLKAVTVIQTKLSYLGNFFRCSVTAITECGRAPAGMAVGDGALPVNSPPTSPHTLFPILRFDWIFTGIFTFPPIKYDYEFYFQAEFEKEKWKQIPI